MAGLANQRDLTVRFMEFFDHYLEGAKAQAWLTKGSRRQDPEDMVTTSAS
jgi:hypothetical protein